MDQDDEQIIWNSLKTSDKSILLHSYKFENNKYIIYITDFIHLYKEVLSHDDIEKRNEQLNPIIEISVGGLLNNLNDMLQSETGSYQFSTEPYTDDKCLKCIYKLQNVKFKWEFYLRKESRESFFNKVTSYLLTSAILLKSRQDMLMKELKCKDKEIEDFVLSGAKLSRKALKTDSFNLEKFNKRTLEIEDAYMIDSKNACSIICSKSLISNFRSLVDLKRKLEQDKTSFRTNDRGNNSLQKERRPSDPSDPYKDESDVDESSQNIKHCKKTRIEPVSKKPQLSQTKKKNLELKKKLAKL